MGSNTTAGVGRGKKKGTPSRTSWIMLNTPALGTPVAWMHQWGDLTGLYGNWPTDHRQDRTAIPFFETPGHPGMMYHQGQGMARGWATPQRGTTIAANPRQAGVHLAHQEGQADPAEDGPQTPAPSWNRQAPSWHRTQRSLRWEVGGRRKDAPSCTSEVATL